MSKRFRNCDLNQGLLLPPSLEDWLPEGHLARFVAEVAETLDLSAIYAVYEAGDGRGLAAALETVYPQVPHQRCWVHKMRNILEHVRHERFSTSFPRWRIAKAHGCLIVSALIISTPRWRPAFGERTIDSGVARGQGLPHSSVRRASSSSRMHTTEFCANSALLQAAFFCALLKMFKALSW